MSDITSGYVSPLSLSPKQRRANLAAMHERAARAMDRAGGISAKRDAPVAREAARKLRAAS